MKPETQTYTVTLTITLPDDEHLTLEDYPLEDLIEAGAYQISKISKAD